MNCHPAEWSAAGKLLIPSAVLAASFLGSLHCVGMCGGLMVAVCKKPAELFSYHIGRLISYMALGSIFGWLGMALETQSLPWISRGTGILMGIVLILMGWQFSKHKTLYIWLPKPFLSVVTNLSAKLLRAKTNSMSLLIPGTVGLLSVLLPCGWLYSYAVAAIALQNSWAGAGLMAIFWLGGLPALSVAPLLIRKLLNPAQQWIPQLISPLLIGLGLWTIIQKFGLTLLPSLHF